MRHRGTGSKYEKHGFWFIKIHADGRVHYESTKLKGPAGEKRADRLLAKYGEQIERGTFQPPQKPATFEEMAAMMEADYKANGRKSLDKALRSIGHLKPFFKRMRAIDFPGKVSEYIAKRKDAGAANASIQLELAALKRMITLAHKAGRIPTKPYIQSIAVSNVRTGFFEPDQLDAVMRHLPAYLQPLILFGSLTGWRRNEMLTLEWRQIDFTAQEIRLDAGSTKNDQGRTLPFSTYPELRDLLLAQREHTAAVERARGMIVSTVFHHHGKPIRDYNHAWREACRKAGCPDRLVHDLRRTAVRNMERAGVPRGTAMQVTGHLTETVYLRYNIIDKRDVEEGLAKLAKAAPNRAGAPTAREA